MAASKLTIDLTDKNRETLEKIKVEQRSPYGTTVNELIDNTALTNPYALA